MPSFLDAVYFLATSSGTGDFVPASAVQGYRLPVTAGAADTITYAYRAESSSLNEWEIGIGTYSTTGPTLARTTVLANHLGTTAKVAFSAAPNVGIVALASDISRDLVPWGRLTLTSGVAVAEADVTAATNIFFTPSANDEAGLYNGSMFTPTQFAELTLALDPTAAHTGYHQSGKNFFLGLFMNAGAITLGTSVAWASDTTTGTGAGTCEPEVFRGRLVNKVSMTVRFGSASGNTVSVPARQFFIVGGFRATADGQATESKSKRLLSNLYNVQQRPVYKTDATGTTFGYSVAAFRQYRADANNKIAVFNCVGGHYAEIFARSFATTSAATARFVEVGIGLDSTTTEVAGGFVNLLPVTSAQGNIVKAEFLGYPGVGYHEFVWLQAGAGADTQTWDPTANYSGMNGYVVN